MAPPLPMYGFFVFLLMVAAPDKLGGNKANIIPKILPLSLFYLWPLVPFKPKAMIVFRDCAFPLWLSPTYLFTFWGRYGKIIQSSSGAEACFPPETSRR